MIQALYFGVVAISLLLLSKQRYKWWLILLTIQMAMMGYTAIKFNNPAARQSAFIIFLSVIIGTFVNKYNYTKLSKWEYFPHLLEGGAVMLVGNSFAGMWHGATVAGVGNLLFLYYIMLFGLVGVGYFFLSFRCYIGLFILGIHYILSSIIWYTEPNAHVMTVLYRPEYCVILAVICFYSYLKLDKDFKEMVKNEKNK